MPTFEVTLTDWTVELIEGADAYQQEGQMTTFFATTSDRGVVDSWSTRIASFRTSELIVVRRMAASPASQSVSTPPPYPLRSA